MELTVAILGFLVKCDVKTRFPKAVEIVKGQLGRGLETLWVAGKKEGCNPTSGGHSIRQKRS